MSRDMKSPQAKRTLIGASAAVVIVAAIVIGIVVASGGGSDGKGGPSGGGGGGGSVASLPKGDLGLALAANKNDAMGVDPKAGFILTSAQNLSVAQVEAALKPTPNVGLKVEPKSEREFKITPARDLEPDSMLKLVFKSPDTGATIGLVGLPGAGAVARRRHGAERPAHLRGAEHAASRSRLTTTTWSTRRPTSRLHRPCRGASSSTSARWSSCRRRWSR